MRTLPRSGVYVADTGKMDMFDTLVSRVFALAQSQPDKTAVAFKTETLTYGQLVRRTVGICRQLAERGVAYGDNKNSKRSNVHFNSHFNFHERSELTPILTPSLTS